MPLDPKGVLEARRKELEYADQKKVWDIVSREEARANVWKNHLNQMDRYK